MRIGLITNAFLPQVGGLEWKVHFLATEYCRQGHEAIVFRSKLPRDEDGPLPVQPQYPIVTVGPRPFPGYGRLGISEVIFSRRIISHHRKQPLGILHCHSLELPTRYGVRVKAKTGIPVVATTCGHDILVCPDIGFGMRIRPYYDRIVRDNVRRVDAVSSISQRVRKELELIGGSAPILDIPNGVDWPAFQCGPNDCLRQRLGLPSSAVLIVSLGRNDPVKGFAIGIRAIARVAAKYPEAHYAIVGEGSAGLATLVGELGMSERVHLLGRIPMTEVPKVLWSADVFFSPSVIEGFAQVVIQAMACGRPCVLSDCPGNEDFWDSPFAVLGRVGDTTSLARALDVVLSDREKRLEMGALAHAASRQYGWDIIAEQYLDVFKALVGRHSRPLGAPA